MPRELAGLVGLVLALITVAHDLLLVLGSNVLSQIPLPQGCELTLWALHSLSLSMLLFDVRCDRRPPP